MESTVKSLKHPCFNVHAKNSYMRVHIPVAKKCNIQCNYCNRKYDCINESRPGVTSTILTPKQSVKYVNLLKNKHDNISVVGVAGPGEPLANPETIETMKLLKMENPNMTMCVSSNGLELYDQIDQLVEVGVTHVTITINSIRASIVSKMVAWVRYKKHLYRGEEGAQLLIENQIKSLTKLKSLGVIVKINSVVVPGVNDAYIEELAEYVAKLGADTMNLIPLYPTKGTIFENIEEPSHPMMNELRKKIAKYILPMAHCRRCRADAVGLLGKDIDTRELMFEAKNDSNRKYVAVASQEGMLVNLHLGEATEVMIYEYDEKNYVLLENRETPSKGSGNKRWKEFSNILSDCKAILVNGVGDKPKKILEESGVEVIEMTGLIVKGLDNVYKNIKFSSMPRVKIGCGKDSGECSGNGMGCM